MTNSIQRTKELIALHIAELNRTGDQLAAWIAGGSPLMSMLHRASDPAGADEADQYARQTKALQHEQKLNSMPKRPIVGKHQFEYFSRYLEANVYVTFNAEIRDCGHLISVDIIELYVSSIKPSNVTDGWQCWGAGFLTDQTCDAIEIELCIEYQRQIDDRANGSINDF